jgi:hypothetical protein
MKLNPSELHGIGGALHDLPAAALWDSTQQALYLRYNFVETKF